ncbi:MAG: nucleoside triphosphate pyrophosphatase [Candidatus Auribacterota bacterium]|nr:nucleoside triphosphate pyrophosphatase [Candidatus Auribacterota bacterium]
MTDHPVIVLASQSLRRKELLRAAGVPFEAVTPDVEEIETLDRPEDTVRFNSRAKAEWGSALYPDSVIIAADTVVFLDRIMGKPETMIQAREMLMELSGRSHKVYTSVTVMLPQGESVVTGVGISRVTMKELDEEVISEYFRAVNPLDKAGGYAIQEYGEMLIDKCEGSFSNVIGLPMEVLGEILGKYPETQRYAELLRG